MTVFSELRMRPATADRWGWDASTTARLVMAGVVIFTLLVGANLATPLYPLLQAKLGITRAGCHGGLLRLRPGAGGHPDARRALVGPHRPPRRPGPGGPGGPRRRLRLRHGGQPARAVRRPGPAGHCGGARHRRQFGGPARAAAQPSRVGLEVHPAGFRRRSGGRAGHRGSALAAARAHVHAVLPAFGGPARAAGPAVPAQGPAGHHLGRGSAAAAGAGPAPALGVQRGARRVLAGFLGGVPQLHRLRFLPLPGAGLFRPDRPRRFAAADRPAGGADPRGLGAEPAARRAGTVRGADRAWHAGRVRAADRGGRRLEQPRGC